VYQQLEDKCSSSLAGLAALLKHARQQAAETQCALAVKEKALQSCNAQLQAVQQQLRRTQQELAAAQQQQQHAWAVADSSAAGAARQGSQV
jgi:chromosome segregation ATPase